MEVSLNEIEKRLIRAKEKQLSKFRSDLAKLEAFDLKSLGQPKSVSFTYKEIETDERIALLSKDLPNQGCCFYYFSTENFQEIIQLFPRNTGKEIKYTRFNNHEQSNIIYVGSSNNLRKRFNEHCGKVANATYAIKFSKWLKGTNFPITFYYFQLNVPDQDLLQMLEDGLWNELKPILGKPGSNNKGTH